MRVSLAGRFRQGSRSCTRARASNQKKCKKFRSFSFPFYCITSTTGVRLFRRTAPLKFQALLLDGDGSLIWAATAAQNQHSTHLAPPGYLVYKRRSDPGTQSVSSASTKFHSQQHQQTYTTGTVQK
jgi:hypothetical protein